MRRISLRGVKALDLIMQYRVRPSIGGDMVSDNQQYMLLRREPEQRGAYQATLRKVERAAG